jgi:hypothetical protein
MKKAVPLSGIAFVLSVAGRFCEAGEGQADARGRFQFPPLSLEDPWSLDLPGAVLLFCFHQATDGDLCRLPMPTPNVAMRRGGLGGAPPFAYLINPNSGAMQFFPVLVRGEIPAKPFRVGVSLVQPPEVGDMVAPRGWGAASWSTVRAGRTR